MYMCALALLSQTGGMTERNLIKPYLEREQRELCLMPQSPRELVGAAVAYC